MNRFVPAPAASPQESIPETPPPALRERYLQLSRAYLLWSLGMLLWSLLCVGYFILTWQLMEMAIGLCLGAMLVAMILFPSTQFGGATWYKRLGWATILTGLFALMFPYPLTVVFAGIWRRAAEGRYSRWPSFNDSWHLLLGILTVLMSAWTAWIVIRLAVLVRRLHRGDYPAVPES